MPETHPAQIVLLGHPIGHSRSPGMQQAALDALGIPARYDLWDIPPEALADHIGALRGPGMLGANVTIPHKTAVVPLLDEIVPEAQRLAGAVNTITREQQHGGVWLVGHNTDIAGLLRVLDEHRAWDGARRMLVLGAGGAAQSALGVGMLRNVEVWVAARRREAARMALLALWQRQQAAPLPLTIGTPPEQVQNTAAPLSLSSQLPAEWERRAIELSPSEPSQLASAERGSEALRDALSHTDILVNATPAGTNDPQRSALPLDLVRDLPQSAFVLDMIYSPVETALVRAAQATGRRATGGLSMLLYQGAAAFTLWTQRPAPLDAMRSALGLREVSHYDTDAKRASRQVSTEPTGA